MASLNELSMVAGVQLQRAAVEAVLRSRTFARNPRLSALLEYLCERCFTGQAGCIKEFNIATDVFGRPAEFDQSQDAIVRVEMHRLRKKLAEFYATEGQQEPIEIVIQSGHYVPQFVFRDNETVAVTSEQRHSPDVSCDAEKWVEEPQPTRPERRRRFWMMAVLLTAAVALGNIAAFIFVSANRRTDAKRTGVGRTRTIASMPSIASPAALPSSDSVRLLCGSSRAEWRDRGGNVWGADNFFSGGTAVELPEHPVYRTRDNFLFRTMRTGDFSYKIPLKAGIYEMHLYFADQSYSPGVTLDGGESMRVFSAVVNGDVLLRDFDIIADAGANTADVRVFKDIRPENDGYLHLTFVRSQGAPLINGIEIVPGKAGCMRPVRIVTQDEPFTDRDGVTWSADDYFLNGRAIERSNPVSGPGDPRIYDRERYGNFSYAIPVADGRFRVTLHFAETFWGGSNPGGGGLGSRVFNVYCNHLSLLHNFDMLKEDGPRTQIVKTFHNLQPNEAGKLLLSFVRLNNYASISAIEVTDEADKDESDGGDSSK